MTVCGRGKAAALPLILAAGLGLAACGRDDLMDEDTAAPRAGETSAVVSAGEALSGAHVPALDPATMPEAQVSKVLGSGPRCAFRYTTTGRTVVGVSTLADGPAKGVVKLNGKLVSLSPRSQGGSPPGAIVLEAQPIVLTVKPMGEPAPVGRATRRVADLVFAVGREAEIGYRGYFDCLPQAPPRSPNR